ncbi:bicoid-interacting protein BIN3, putative [Plasmodium knowlesi strain H]|uniref:RNA methyltransferase n=3 Tax=Plasmodium knowlesi TaxID=5850 RepID=A0A5K1UDS8_PLAKH|nr:bicoid-interacting protein BIN3, putative [Plasmodium knowlesi strain H]OTN65239.1 putative Bicoid-interacting protein BIN3 [Plasmodium knowlesi]CAA9988479.1 bicoid-interacting protein BIN3, putative [Plasmodium knowlesi strain H]SBO19749.1 bicoid-interacting protein BIN3, putative [Plasmodium knowlesi strain H]SBO20481.1 bicoid-interacting protein BIN3, putative [Plasmodium knowlesi strain H]VVS77953.1 bicoid-interacting protein BIN3, putative [Plasmodium knowlesi strain H]|eukprot:XP_002259460.1 hypothetical protein, conserved in Plasmodium species [Plasmodium knowlesi strain H]
MTSCIFSKTEKKELQFLKRHFRVTHSGVVQPDKVIYKRKRGKRVRQEIYLHGNYPNYFYERYWKRKKKCEEIPQAEGVTQGEDEQVKDTKEADKQCKANERICKVMEVVETDKKEIIDDYRLTHVDNLMKGIFYGKDILDIGCNCGVTTFLLSLKYKCRIVNGIDIDCNLINNNITLLKFFIEFVLVYNSQNHLVPFFLRHRNLTQMQRDIFLEVHLLREVGRKGTVEGKRGEAVKGHALKSDALKSDELKSGELKSDGAMDKGVGGQKITPHCEQVFPFNIYFSCSNIFDQVFQSAHRKYDVIICFSVLKWIHLNHGDAQVILFFDHVHSLLKEGGHFILEYHNEIKYKVKKCDRGYYTHETNLNYKNFDAIAQGAYQNSSRMNLVERTIFDANWEEGPSGRKKKPGMFSRIICIYQKV